MRIVRVSTTEYELADGTVRPIEPPLEQEMPIEEFEAIYRKTSAALQSCGIVGGHDSDSANVGQRRQASSNPDGGEPTTHTT